VQNSGTETAKLKVSLKKFKADGATGQPQLADREAADTYFDWVSFSPARFTAEPQQWKEVAMTIKVPSDAALGYYLAPVFSLDTAGQDKPEANASQLQGATAVLVLLDVQVPGEKKQLEISSFSANKKLYEYLPANFTVKIKNSGDIHLKPAGSIFITKGKKTIATLNINPNGGNILPKSSRNFETAWSDGFPVFEVKRVNNEIQTGKDGKPIQELKWNFAHANRLRFGHYTAHLIMTYDNGERDVPVEASVSFWVVPWGLILLIIAIPTIPAVLVYLIMKHRFKRQGSKRTKNA
jgi:hypothetical protein